MSVIDEAIKLDDKDDAAIMISDHILETRQDSGQKLTQKETYIACVFIFDQELNNGGFDQFFWNSSGDRTQITLDGLRAIGADKTADLLKSAMAIFPDGIIPEDRNKRQEIMDSIEDKTSDSWEQLDNKFYDYEDDLTELIIEYIKKNRKEFL